MPETPSALASTWPGCSVCKHLEEALRCAAYPDGIPFDIAAGQLDHMVERPGQVKGILFEQKPLETP